MVNWFITERYAINKVPVAIIGMLIAVFSEISEFSVLLKAD
jgi:hypothetical protein